MEPTIIYFDNLAETGIIKDTDPHELPQTAWSDGKNVRFFDGAVHKFTGDEAVYGTAVASPWFAMQIQAASTKFWHYASLTDIYATDGVNHNNITPTGSTGSLGATLHLNWTGGALGGGVYVLNNGVDAPLQWVGSGITDVYSALSNWPASTYCRVLRPFKQFLVAADIDEGSGRDGTLLRWSHPAVPGSIPSSWDYTDRTKDAGRVSISQTPDYIVEMEPLRDINMIYKEHNIWSMQFVGGNNKFAFRKVFGEISILSRRCVVNLFGRHVVLGGDDLIIHDGNDGYSLIDKLWRKWLTNNIDGTYFDTSFLAIDHQNNEVWACIPQTGHVAPNIAMVWNWKNNTITLRELNPTCSHIAWGVIDTGGDLTFDGESGTFDSTLGVFDEQIDSGVLRELLLCDPSASQRFYRGNSTEQFHGSNITAYVQRDALPLGRQDSLTGKIKVDSSSVKTITEIWPIIEGTDGGQVSIYIGHRKHINDTVSWAGPYTYTIGTTRKIDVRVAGQIIDIKFQSTTNISWRLLSYGLKVRLGGIR